jgi:nucleoside-diphosphate-sugar epimerase
LIIELTSSRSSVELVSYEQRYGPRFEDTKRRVPSLVRAHDVLGYSPTVDLRDGLLRTLSWWRETHG